MTRSEGGPEDERRAETEERLRIDRRQLLGGAGTAMLGLAGGLGGAALLDAAPATPASGTRGATGTSFEMNAIAAAVLGGTSLAGGRGTIGGTIIGAFVIGVLSDGLVMMGVSEFWQMVIKGLVIIAAVVLDQMQRKMAKR